MFQSKGHHTHTWWSHTDSNTNSIKSRRIRWSHTDSNTRCLGEAKQTLTPVHATMKCMSIFYISAYIGQSHRQIPGEVTQTTTRVVSIWHTRSIHAHATITYHTDICKPNTTTYIHFQSYVFQQPVHTYILIIICKQRKYFKHVLITRIHQPDMPNTKQSITAEIQACHNQLKRRK
jgi:hypothetical protein